MTVQGHEKVFRHLRHAFCGQMADLILKIAKDQINFCILPIYPEKIIGIKQVWPQQRPQWLFEVKLQIYTLILFCFHDREY